MCDASIVHACCFLCKRRADNIPEILDVMQDPSVTRKLEPHVFGFACFY